MLTAGTIELETGAVIDIDGLYAELPE